MERSRDHAPDTCAATPKSAAPILGAARVAFRRVFWDWVVITLGALPLGAVAIGSLMSHEWTQALGYGLAAFYALLTFGEGAMGESWERRARDLDKKLCAFVDAAHVRHADGSTEPFADYLEKHSGASE